MECKRDGKECRLYSVQKRVRQMELSDCALRNKAHHCLRFSPSQQVVSGTPCLTSWRGRYVTTFGTCLCLLYLPLIAFFCSLARRRSTFFMSSAGGKFSGTIPRCISMLRTAALFSMCSFSILVLPCRSFV